MNFKLYTDKKYNDPIEQILKSRGIEDIDKWMNASLDDVANWNQLNNMRDAIILIHDFIELNKKTVVIADSDADGFSSAAILINYFNDIAPEWVKNNLDYIMHSGKQHGLSDLMEELVNYDLVISPDGGSNDYEQIEELSNRGVWVVILDHHEAPYASTSGRCITVNNQLDDYPNKALCGGGVCWQFCRGYDELYNYDFAKEYIDLCALAEISDMMDCRNIEVRALIKEGLADIKNPFFYGMVQKNEFSMNKKGGKTHHGVAWYVTPFINAAIRTGTPEEKELVFRAMCKPYAFEKIESGKRGAFGNQVSLYEEAVRIAANIKTRQNKLEKEALELMDRKIQEENLLENAVLILACEPGEVEKNVAGLVANKLQGKYQRPSLVLTKSKTIDDDEYYYRGSMRNYSMSEIQNFKDILEGTNIVEFCQGHQGAAGTGVAESKLEALTKELNNIYSNVSKEPIYWVDYIWRTIDLDNKKILEIGKCKDYWGQEIPESKIGLKDICLKNCSVSLCGKNNDTLRLILPDGTVCVKWRVDEDTFNSLLEDNMYMTAYCTPDVNEFNGNVSGEFIIEEWELRKKWIF